MRAVGEGGEMGGQWEREERCEGSGGGRRDVRAVGEGGEM